MDFILKWVIEKYGYNLTVKKNTLVWIERKEEVLIQWERKQHFQSHLVHSFYNFKFS